jgi:hypothetical protein
MVGRAFILLKAGCTGPKSTEQAEIRLAILPTILWIGRIGDGKFPRKGVGMRAMVVLGRFYGIWLTAAQLSKLSSRSQF